MRQLHVIWLRLRAILLVGRIDSNKHLLAKWLQLSGHNKCSNGAMVARETSITKIWLGNLEAVG
jgi:hypothetical protein